MTRHCIIRMAGPRTLNVVQALQARGVDVWTPTGMRRNFKPRSTKYTDKTAPLLPTFAFARAEHIPQLLEITHSPAADIRFSVFQRGEDIPTVSSAALQPLLDYEAEQHAIWVGFIEAQDRADRRKRKKTTARCYVMGQRVKVEKPAFAGLTGEIVEIRSNGDLVLEFAGFIRGTTVPSCDVTPIQLSGASSELDKAA